jgi:site-specific recombinase XerD
LKYLATREISFIYLAQEAALIPRQKSIRKKVCGMSKKAVKALMSVPDTNTRTGRRDLALLIFMYSTAVRIDEALSLKVGQLPPLPSRHSPVRMTVLFSLTMMYIISAHR